MTASPDHHGSHCHLLWTLSGSHQGRVDAIIVPTVRSPASLTYAAELTRVLACPLVTLHSGKWTSARMTARRLPTNTDLIAIDIPDPTHLRLPDFATSRLLAGSRFARRTDTSAKRNIALVLSRLIGWQRVIFLDDDIVDVNPDDLRQAAGMLDIYSAVGLSIGGFPDNSVVCHAYRAVGGEQESFIGGGALAVEVSRNRSFFPDIYNEDWFYLLDAKKQLQPLGVVGRVVQQPYDPYRTPERARNEEFGDVLAEGAFWLLDNSRNIIEADASHWKGFLAQRNRFIEHVLTLVQADKMLEYGEQVRMVEALKAARGRLAHITPDFCQRYLNALAEDQQRWQHHIDDLNRQPIDVAIRLLPKPGKPALTWCTTQRPTL